MLDNRPFMLTQHTQIHTYQYFYSLQTNKQTQLGYFLALLTSQETVIQESSSYDTIRAIINSKANSSTPKQYTTNESIYSSCPVTTILKFRCTIPKTTIDPILRIPKSFKIEFIEIDWQFPNKKHRFFYLHTAILIELHTSQKISCAPLVVNYSKTRHQCCVQISCFLVKIISHGFLATHLLSFVQQLPSISILPCFEFIVSFRYNQHTIFLSTKDTGFVLFSFISYALLYPFSLNKLFPVFINER
eukprot:TRINITY_DN6066_c0_g1_i2.p1 TRINITY_DN6066_c0_g1~~TRINITY_DN6066_c0_g1_i2.p1  ORF type:complete len:246 (+),score=-28.79 TRINITY_DN6066_c0_g1_i2:197-934(+)